MRVPVPDAPLREGARVPPTRCTKNGKRDVIDFVTKDGMLSHKKYKQMCQGHHPGFRHAAHHR